MNWLGIAATAVTGLIGPTSGEWQWDLVGDLTDDSATGGALGDLEASTGRKYPDLQAKRQAVVDAWRNWQRAFLKTGPWATYETKLKEFASALEKAVLAAEPAPEVGGPGGIFEQLKEVDPIMWVLMVVFLVLTVSLVAFRRK